MNEITQRCHSYFVAVKSIFRLLPNRWKSKWIRLISSKRSFISASLRYTRLVDIRKSWIEPWILCDSAAPVFYIYLYLYFYIFRVESHYAGGRLYFPQCRAIASRKGLHNGVLQEKNWLYFGLGADRNPEKAQEREKERKILGRKTGKGIEEGNGEL